MSTLLGVVLTPWLSWLYIDAQIVVPVWAMLKMILLLVIVPVAAGIAVNQLLPRLVKPLQPLCPAFAVVAIVLIIAIVVALNAERMAAVSFPLLLAVMAYNLTGLSLAYLISRFLGHSSVTARTLAIEVGMQNSGLAVALALKNFAAMAALPGALFSIWHNISGSLFAAYWQWRHRSEQP
jgi:BASS family bile acid:Na+ symporter